MELHSGSLGLFIDGKFVLQDNRQTVTVSDPKGERVLSFCSCLTVCPSLAPSSYPLVLYLFCCKVRICAGLCVLMMKIFSAAPLQLLQDFRCGKS